MGQKYDNKSDMWMLGCVLYELCTLSRPFKGDGLHAVYTQITKADYAKLSNSYDEIFHKLVDVLL